MAVADVNSTIRHSGLPDGVQKQVYFEEYKVPFIVTYYKIACRLSMFVRLIERHVWRSILSREHFYRLMRALSDLPTVFPQALSTLLATVCPLRSVKHPRIIRLLYIHKKEEIDVTSQKSWWVTLVFFIHFPQKNPKNNQKKQKESYQFRLFFFFGLILRFFVVFFVCSCLFLFLLLGSRRHVEIYSVWGSRRLLGFPPQSFTSVPCQVEPSWTFPLGMRNSSASCIMKLHKNHFQKFFSEMIEMRIPLARFL